jgi:adenylylsulfate kinase
MGIVTINAFISPTNQIRRMAKSIIGKDRFLEIYLTTPIEVCMQRDPKGFYRKIKTGNVKNFSGVDSVFEPSSSAALYLDTSQLSIQQCVEEIFILFVQNCLPQQTSNLYQ